MNFHKKAFGLVELLIALGILAVVGWFIFTKYTDVQTQAMWTAARSMEKDFNKMISHWKDLGGTLTGNVYTSDILDMLASSSLYSKSGITDSGNSQSIRMAIAGDAETTSKLGYAKRGCYLGSDHRFMADWNNLTGYMGVVPVINNKVPYYYWGTGDSNRHIISTKAGASTVMILQKAGNLCYTMEPFDYITSSGGVTLAQNIEGGQVLFLASDNPDIGPDVWGTDWSIETFTKHLDSSGNPVISEDYFTNEDFFNGSQTDAQTRFDAITPQ